MQELVKRLAELDPAAAEELRVVEHFDALVEARAGLEAFVRAAAIMAGCPAGLSVPNRRIAVRVLATGQREVGHPSGIVRPLRPDEPAVVWLERSPGAPRPTDLMILERLAAGMRVVLDRTRNANVNDPASIELLLDARATLGEREAAAKRLGLATTGFFFVVASTHGGAVPGAITVEVGTVIVHVCTGTPSSTVLSGRVGVGSPGPFQSLPNSYEEAVLALRLAGLGTAADPGPSQVFAEDLGGLLGLAAVTELPCVQHDVSLVESLAAEHVWALPTLYALTTETSLRAAAAFLKVHHSTLQSRIACAEQHLGYSLQAQLGRTRTHIALCARRLASRRG